MSSRQRAASLAAHTRSWQRSSCIIMDEQKSTGILPSLQALVDKRAIRQRKQREYYAEKGKEVRRKYYLANIEEKRRASREYHRKRRELFKEYECIALGKRRRLSRD